MKQRILAAAISLALTASAFAADLPSRKAPPYLPPPPPPPLWTGFYVGLNAGGTWNATNNVSVVSFPGACDPTRAGCGAFVPSYGATMAAAATFTAPGSTGGGFIGGGQIGYNWQFATNFVAGIEADIQGVTNSSNGSVVQTGAVAATIAPGGAGFPLASTAAFHRSLDYLGTVRGRLGWLFTPTLLAYATGGLAYGGVNSSVAFSQGFFTDPTVGPIFGNGFFSDTRVGWTVGGGLEWLFLPNWSAKVEYLYYDLGNVTYSVNPLITLSTLTNTVTGSAIPQVQSRFNGHIVRAGVNYHFNWGVPAPVVAKY